LKSLKYSYLNHLKYLDDFKLSKYKILDKRYIIELSRVVISIILLDFIIFIKLFICQIDIYIRLANY